MASTNRNFTGQIWLSIWVIMVTCIMKSDTVLFLLKASKCMLSWLRMLTYLAFLVFRPLYHKLVQLYLSSFLTKFLENSYINKWPKGDERNGHQEAGFDVSIRADCKQVSATWSSKKHALNSLNSRNTGGITAMGLKNHYEESTTEISLGMEISSNVTA